MPLMASGATRSHWLPAYVGMGSNLQGPAVQLDSAFDRLSGISKTRLVSRSSLYRSAPLGGIEQPDFVNAVAALLTRLSARQLLSELQQIEQQHGRERNDVRWGPRVLDLDLLVYSDKTINEPDLTVPHAGIAERNFVLLPLGEIAPDLFIPGLGHLADIAVDESEPRISRIA